MYSLDFQSQARQDLGRLSASARQRLAKRLDWFIAHFDELQPEPLTGKWAGYFKFRVGDYRVIYQVDRAARRIIVHRIRHRREVYKS
ncbi:MAG: type II toxin-antitoxin system RelE/ParE family toxin [Chloroflexota bacterium]|nr:MAG: type II toxin-antitoxin system RelE/ParE family toxin [Chloroflexota bacterium]